MGRQPRQRRALAVLFSVLTLAFVALAALTASGAGGSAPRWLVTVAAFAIGAWFAGLARQSWRRD